MEILKAGYSGVVGAVFVVVVDGQRIELPWVENASVRDGVLVLEALDEPASVAVEPQVVVADEVDDRPAPLGGEERVGRRLDVPAEHRHADRVAGPGGREQRARPAQHRRVGGDVGRRGEADLDAGVGEAAGLVGVAARGGLPGCGCRGEGGQTQEAGREHRHPPSCPHGRPP